MAPPIVLNPNAVLKSIEEQYNYGIATGISDQSYYASLQAQMDRWVQRWQQTIPEQGQDPYTYQAPIAAGKQLSQKLSGATENAGLVSYSRTRDDAIAAGAISRDALDAEISQMQQNGASLVEITKFMQQSGQYTVEELTNVAKHWGDPNYDPGAAMAQSDAKPNGTSDTAIPPPSGSSDFKPFEKVAPDFTDPKTEFQNGFAQFTRGLETSLHGKTPQIGALQARYNDLYNSYLGAIETGRADGSQPKNVWKEEFVNVGKSTDPQFDQTSDRFKQQTVRPTISAFDWILKNVDPEDVYASTAPRDRPGTASTGGFVGYVSRRG